MKFLPRESLPHDVPPWVKHGSWYFFTLCAHLTSRALTAEGSAKPLLEAVAHYHRVGRWHVRLCLLMPDHLHAVAAFAQPESMGRCWRDWKRYTTRNAGVIWQRDWFEHRLRDAENVELKLEYIRQNPVRKGLVAHPNEWPWKYEGG